MAASSAAQRFGSGDLAVRAGDIRGPDEVEQLAASFDQMAGQVQATVQAQRAFAANASHQLRTPLTGMKLRLESAIADTDDEDVRSELVETEAEVDRLSAIVDRLLTTASRAEAKPTDVIDLAHVARQAVERWDAQAREAQTDLVADVGAAPAMVDGSDVEQIIDNLLDNAIAYAPGRVEVSTGLAEGRAFVAVRDHGPGIAEPDFPHITERFYRGEGPQVPGSGLGLAIVQELAKQANGAVVITQPTGGGTRIEVRYPSALLTAP